MGLTLSQLAADKAEITFPPFDGSEDTVTLTYAPSKITPSRKAKLMAGLDGDDEQLVEWLSEVVVAWDILGEDGKPLPVAPETMLDLPSRFIGRMFTQIASAQSPPEGNTGS